MGVYFKGKEMPKNCGVCDIPCGIRSYDRILFGFDETRPKNCPIVEVKEPHGRLVDYETIDVDYWEDADGYHISVEAETVIEEEE